MGKYDALQQRLQARNRELGDRLARIQQDLARPHAADSEEQAQERENDEVLERLGRDAEAERQSVLAALERLKAGRYGTCVKCSAEIPLARLDARPEAIHCTACAA